MSGWAPGTLTIVWSAVLTAACTPSQEPGTPPNEPGFRAPESPSAVDPESPSSTRGTGARVEEGSTSSPDGKFTPLCSLPAQKPCSVLLRAERLLDEGQTEEASRLLEEETFPDGRDPEDWAFSLLKARVLLESDSLSYGSGSAGAQQAETLLLHALSSMGVRPGVEQGDAATVGDVAGAPQRSARADRLRFQRCRAGLSLGKGEEVLPILVELANSYGRESELQASLGIAYLSVGRVRESLGPLRAAVRLDPEEPERHLVLGTAAMLAADYGQAESSFRAALARDGSSARAHGDLGALLLLMGRIDEGRAHLERARRLAPRAASYSANLAYAELLADNPVACETYARKALALDANLSAGWLNLGLCLVALGKAGEAREAFLRAQALDPTDPRPRNNLRDLEELADP